MRDNGRHNLKASFTGKDCFFYTYIAMAIKASLKIENVSDALCQKNRDKLQPLQYSTKEKLKNIQKELNLANAELVQNVTMKWNSIYSMLERIVE